MIKISSLAAADLSQAYAIEQRSHAFPWSEQTLAVNQGERFVNLRIDKGGEMAGFAICQRVLDEASLFNVAIDPRWQRQGLGRTLLEALIERLASLDVATLWLEVRASNHAAIALYEQLEFNQVSRRRNYYPTATGKEDALLMALTV